jgi:hypothetical protein
MTAGPIHDDAEVDAVISFTCGAGRVVALSLSLLALAGCAAEAESPQPAPANLATQASGVLQTSAGRYEFTPSTCAVYREDGVDDVEIGGSGTAPDGQAIYFELSSTGNSLSVGLGVDGPFASAERKLQAGRYVSREFTLEIAGETMFIGNLALVDENGQSVDDAAILTIDCGG